MIQSVLRVNETYFVIRKVSLARQAPFGPGKVEETHRPTQRHYNEQIHGEKWERKKSRAVHALWREEELKRQRCEEKADAGGLWCHPVPW